jgi:hypothetical protein
MSAWVEFWRRVRTEPPLQRLVNIACHVIWSLMGWQDSHVACCAGEEDLLGGHCCIYVDDCKDIIK